MEATPGTKFKTVDEYLSAFPGNVKAKLQELRNTVKKTAPQAEELISYNMPSFTLQGRLLYYAAYKAHIGFYPMASGIEAFRKELSAYKWAKGSVQFPMDKSLPLSLIRKMVKFRVKENLEKADARVIKRKRKR